MNIGKIHLGKDQKTTSSPNIRMNIGRSDIFVSHRLSCLDLCQYSMSKLAKKIQSMPRNTGCIGCCRNQETSHKSISCATKSFGYPKHDLWLQLPLHLVLLWSGWHGAPGDSHLLLKPGRTTKGNMWLHLGEYPTCLVWDAPLPWIPMASGRLIPPTGQFIQILVV